ncbi:hypothetical protein MTO96_051950 [Rhipicephalus appendiculatus]
MNEAMSLLESDCNEQTTFSKVINKLVASRDELRKIDAELEEVIPVKELERVYESVAHYDDQALETPTRLRCRLEGLSLENTRQQTSTSARLNTPLAPTTAESQSFGPRLRTLTIKPFEGDPARRARMRVSTLGTRVAESLDAKGPAAMTRCRNPSVDDVQVKLSWQSCDLRIHF